MSKTILVVGINGFVGKHLAGELADSGLTVHGTGLDPKVAPEIEQYVSQYSQCDMTDPADIRRLDLDDIDGVINLAALATPSQASIDAEQYHRVNVLAHTNLMEYLVELNKKIRVLAISTGAVYATDQTMPLTEESKVIEAGSPYAMSKLEMEHALEKFKTSGCEVVIVRPFNHTGPGQGPGFIVPDLANKLLGSDKLEVGPLNTSRDYTHVGDVVKAYRLLIEHPAPLKHTVYNVCSGVATSRDDLVRLIQEATGKTDIEVTVNQNLGRPSDPLILYGSHDRITAETAWEPTKTVAEIVDDYVSWLKSQ